MKEIDQLLAIADRDERQEALVKYAQFLDINPRHAAEEDGGLNEEKLVAMIYDSIQTHNKEKSKEMNFVSIGAFYLFLMIALLVALPRIIHHLSNKQEEKLNVDTHSYVGVDAQGNPVSEDEDAAFYKVMDGLYEDYYENGKVKIEYKYVNGKLVRQKEFNKKGELTNIIKFK